MEVYENSKKRNNGPLSRVNGDSFRGLYYPYIVKGRSRVLYNDINTLLVQFLETCRGLKLDSDLIIQFSKLFKKLYFSKILIRLNIEDIQESWELLWGVWSELFINPPREIPESDLIYYKLGLIFTCFYLYHSQIPDSSLCNLSLSVPISQSTLERLLDYANILFEDYKSEIAIELIHYLYRQGAFIVCFVDGPQYLHQDRLGNPLKPIS